MISVLALFFFARRRVSRSAQPPDFFGRQVPPMPELQLAVAERSDGDALQVPDRMADGVTHLAHLAVAPFPHCDLEQGVAVAFAAARAQGCRARGRARESVILYGPRGPIFFTAPGAPPPGALAVAFAPARAQGCRSLTPRARRAHALARGAWPQAL